MDKEIDKIITKLEGCFGIFDYVLTPIESNLLVSHIKTLQQQVKKQKEVIDKDSTPDNKKDGEDDIDVAKVILSIATGSAKTYFTLTLGLLTIVLVGIALIKRFVI